jgi:hypothetical protein
MSLHGFPPLAVVELHPIVHTIFGLSGILQGLSEKISEVVIVWLVLKSKVAHVAKILVEFLWGWKLVNVYETEQNAKTYQGIPRTDP